MKLKRICKAVLYPPLALLLVLLPSSTVLLIYSMIFLGSTAVVSCISYALAAYTLTVTSLRIPAILSFLRQFRGSNRLVRSFFEDARWRTTISLHASLLFNTAYAVFHMGLGFYHASFWFHSLAAYYLLLAVTRFFLLRRTKDGSLSQEQELCVFRTTGWFLLLVNLLLSLIIFFMVYWGRSFHHHEITTIAMAAYTFTTLTVAIVGIVRHRRKDSPVLLSARAIGLAAACVSMLTLESTMLTTFGGNGMSQTDKRLFLGLSGGAVSLFMITMAVYMIAVARKNLPSPKEHTHENP